MQPGAVRADLLPLPAKRVLHRHRAELELLQGEILSQYTEYSSLSFTFLSRMNDMEYISGRCAAAAGDLLPPKVL